MFSGVGILQNGNSADVGLAPLGDGVRMTKPSGVRGDGAVFALRIRLLKACGCTYVVIEIHLLLA
jgi:hypothetical protein